MTDPNPTASKERATRGRYVITTPGSLEEVSRPFETLTAAQRALESARQIYPDAYITTIDRVPLKQ